MSGNWKITNYNRNLPKTNEILRWVELCFSPIPFRYSCEARRIFLYQKANGIESRWYHLWRILKDWTEQELDSAHESWLTPQQNGAEQSRAGIFRNRILLIRLMPKWRYCDEHRRCFTRSLARLFHLLISSLINQLPTKLSTLFVARAQPANFNLIRSPDRLFKVF